ncbi:MAG: hypothetical protein PHR92_14385 [Lachnospiraceae bacterium]|nr:hypothetical protein [Lachnospiraceae bacterium]
MKGKSRRLTQEEILEGKSQEEKAGGSDHTAEAADQWQMTTYVQDVSGSIAQVLEETTAGVTTRYDYGLERLHGKRFL